MISFRKINLKFLSLIGLVLFGVLSSFVFASNNPNFQLTINPGTLAVDVVYNTDIDGSLKYDPISNPVFTFNSVGASTECQSGLSSPNLILGDSVVSASGYVSGGYLYIQNPDASSDGFSVSLAATGGKNAFWVASSGQNSLDYNNSDCINDSTKMNYVEVNGTVYGGRMYVDPSVASIQNGKCVGSCSVNGLSFGSANSFQYDSVDSITLLQADASSDNIADYMINGINVSQTIPAMTPSDNYSLDMTMSVISNGNGGAPVVGMRSQNPITYNGYNVEGSDVYVGPGDSVTLNSSGSDLNWGFVDQGFSAAFAVSIPPSLSNDYGSSTVVSAGTGSKNLKVTASFQAKLDTWYSDVNIHFGTGKDCGNNVWVSNSSVCPASAYTDFESCSSAGYTYGPGLCYGTCESYNNAYNCNINSCNWNGSSCSYPGF